VAPTIIADLSPIELRGLFQGIFGSTWGLAYFLGPLLGGQIYERFGAQALWTGTLAIGMVLALAYFLLGRLSTAAHPMKQQASD
jgi:MFS family permease